MSHVLQHQGHFGSAEYSQADQVFFGKLLYIRALVTYESGTAKGLEKAFKEAVSDYLATCEAEGIAPEQPFKGSFNVRIGRDLHRKIAVAASKHNMSLNKYIAELLERSADLA